VFNPVGALIAAARLAGAVTGQKAQVWTARAETTIEAQLGMPLMISTQKILLRAS
jgi:hypothetical protein